MNLEKIYRKIGLSYTWKWIFIEEKRCKITSSGEQKSIAYVKIRIDREILRKNRYQQGDSSGNADCPHIGIGYKLVFAVEATA